MNICRSLLLNRLSLHFGSRKLRRPRVLSGGSWCQWLVASEDTCVVTVLLPLLAVRQHHQHGKSRCCRFVLCENEGTPLYFFVWEIGGRGGYQHPLHKVPGRWPRWEESCSPCILKERFNQGQSKQSKQRGLCTREVFLWWHSVWAYTTDSSCASWEAFRQVIEWLIGQVQNEPHKFCLLEAQRYRWPAKIMKRPTVHNKTIMFLSTQSRRGLLSNAFNIFRGCMPVGWVSRRRCFTLPTFLLGFFEYILPGPRISTINRSKICFLFSACQFSCPPNLFVWIYKILLNPNPVYLGMNENLQSYSLHPPLPMEG